MLENQTRLNKQIAKFDVKFHNQCKQKNWFEKFEEKNQDGCFVRQRKLKKLFLKVKTQILIFIVIQKENML